MDQPLYQLKPVTVPRRAYSLKHVIGTRLEFSEWKTADLVLLVLPIKVHPLAWVV